MKLTAYLLLSLSVVLASIAWWLGIRNDMRMDKLELKLELLDESTIKWKPERKPDEHGMIEWYPAPDSVIIDTIWVEFELEQPEVERGKEM